MFLSRLPTRSPLIRNFNAPTGQKLFIYRQGGSPGSRPADVNLVGTKRGLQ